MDIVRRVTKLTRSGNSDAIDMRSKGQRYASILFSNVTGGTVRLEYTLDSKTEVNQNTAVWHVWSFGDISKGGGLATNDPFNFIKVVASSNSTSYILSILI